MLRTWIENNLEKGGQRSRHNTCLVWTLSELFMNGTKLEEEEEEVEEGDEKNGGGSCHIPLPVSDTYLPVSDTTCKGWVKKKSFLI